MRAAAVLQAIGGDVLRPAVVAAVLDGVFDAFAERTGGPAIAHARGELANLEAEIGRLVEALASGGDMVPVLDALKARQARREALQRTIMASTTVKSPLDRKAIERLVLERLIEWRALLMSSVADGRQLFRETLSGPIRFTPEKGDELIYRFEGEVQLGRLFSGIAGLAPFMASPAGFEPALPA